MPAAYEQTLYFVDGVQVTPTLVRIDDASYPINGIGSVFIKPAKRTLPVLLAILFLLVAVVFSQSDTGLAGGAILLTFVCAVAAVLAKNGLILRTSSGDQRALAARGRRTLLEVKAAIEQAVALRG